MRISLAIAIAALLATGAGAAELRYPQFPPLPRPPRDPANAPTPARRNLGAVSVIGPLRMDYPGAIIAVRQAATELSRFVAEVYDE